MNSKLLQEAVDRAGVLAVSELSKQLGADKTVWHKAALKLIEQREVYLCHLCNAEETLLSRHFMLCLHAVYTEPALSDTAQEIYDWLTDNAAAPLAEICSQSGSSQAGCIAAIAELQQKLSIAPIACKRQLKADEAELQNAYQLCYTTYEQWHEGVHRAARYSNLEYCMSEISRTLKPHFTAQRLNNLIYKGKL